MNNITWNFKSDDPLVIENLDESVPKNQKLMKGI